MFSNLYRNSELQRNFHIQNIVARTVENSISTTAKCSMCNAHRERNMSNAEAQLYLQLVWYGVAFAGAMILGHWLGVREAKEEVQE
jgi:hypothetical protein